MQTKISLIALALLILSLTSFGQSNQVQTYKAKYFKIYKEGELIAKNPANQITVTVDESMHRIERNTSKDYENDIFKIISIDDSNKTVTLYETQLLNDHGGYVNIIIMVNKFYKTITIAPAKDNKNGLVNYLEYQYE